MSVQSVEILRGDLMRKKLIGLGAVLLACFCLFVGCGGARYHATLYSKAQSWIDEEFLKENRVYGAAYPNEDYVEGVSEWDEQYIWDKTSPHMRTFIIKTEEEYQRISPNGAVEIDFEKQIVILHTFCDITTRECTLHRITMENNILYVYYKRNKANGDIGGTTAPYQRCFMLVMDNADFETVEFIEK